MLGFEFNLSSSGNDCGCESSGQGLGFNLPANSCTVDWNNIINKPPLYPADLFFQDSADIDFGGGGNIVTAVLTPTGVIPGTYGGAITYPIVTVDTKGRITAIDEGVISAQFITSVSDTSSIDLDVTAQVLTASLTLTGVASGNYGDVTNYAAFFVDAQGRLTAAGSFPIPVTGVIDTNSIGLTLSSQQLSSDLKLSGTSAPMGNVLVTNIIDANGLYSYFPTSSLDSIYWKLDGNTVGSKKWIGTIDNFDLPFRTNNTEWATLSVDGNLYTGGSYTGTARLQIRGALTSTQLILAESFGGTQSLLVQSDGRSAFGPVSPASVTTLTVIGTSNGNILSLLGSVGPTNRFIVTDGGAITHTLGGSNITSGTLQAISSNGGGFSPTSGNALFNHLAMFHTINQTGTAVGVTRGLTISPTLTSASRYLAIDIRNGHIVFPAIYSNTNISLQTAFPPSQRLHYDMDATSGALTFILPIINTTILGIMISIKKVDNSINPVTITSGGLQNIEYGSGSTSINLVTQYTSRYLIANTDGVNMYWSII